MMAASVGLQLLVLLTQTAVDAAVARSESIIDDGVGSAIVAEFRQELGTYGFEPTTTGTTTGTTPPQFSISPSGTTIASLREKTVVTVSIDLLKASRLERRRHFIMVIEKARALFDAAPANPASGSHDGARDARRVTDRTQNTRNENAAHPPQSSGRARRCNATIL